MEQAADIVRSALLELEAVEAESSIESSEMQTGIKYLNRMMDAFTAEGINLGFTRINNEADYVTIPGAAVEAVVSNLALKLGKQFGGASQEVYLAAREGKKTLYRLTVNIVPMSQPSTLPRGIAQSSGQGMYVDPFYPKVNTTPSATLTLTANTTETPIATVSTPVAVLGTFAPSNTNLMTATAAGLITYDKTEPERTDISLTARIHAASGTVNAKLYLMVNGAEVRSIELTCDDANATAKEILATVQLTYKDTVSVYVSNETDTSNLVVSDCVLSI